MNPHAAVLMALSALVLSPFAMGQGVPSWERSSARMLALRGVEPFAELEEAGMPLPPTPTEMAQVPFLRRTQEQTALKTVWLERLIRAQEQRSRVTRENLSRQVVMARRLGAPAAFAESLSRMAAGNISPRERYLQERCQQAFLDAYGVDARELRFFVEGCGLSPAELRDAAQWLPLPALFNLPAADAAAGISAARLRADYVAALAARRDAAQLLSSVSDRSSADAAAEALLPVLLRQLTTRDALLGSSEEFRSQVLAPYVRFAAPVDEALIRERARLAQQRWYGSHRLQVLDYLMN